MPGKHTETRGARRAEIPSQTPLPGIDDEPVDAGADSGAQLPPKSAPPVDANAAPTTPRKGRRKRGLNPNQADLLDRFWPDE